MDSKTLFEHFETCNRTEREDMAVKLIALYDEITDALRSAKEDCYYPKKVAPEAHTYYSMCAQRYDVITDVFDILGIKY